MNFTIISLGQLLSVDPPLWLVDQHACMHVCVYICVYVCTYMYTCMHSCLHVWYVCISAGSILDISKYRDTCERSILILHGIAILRYIEYGYIVNIQS